MNVQTENHGQCMSDAEKLGKVSAGLNGFGRFGLHLLKYWLDRSKESAFSIDYMSDPLLTIADVRRSIASDHAVSFAGYKIKTVENTILISTPLQVNHEIKYCHDNRLAFISWIGQPSVVFECSGRHAEFPAEAKKAYLTRNTRHVIISATSYDADATLVFGYNHQTFDYERHRLISYGSCTVNAFVPLAEWMHDQFGLVDSDVHVAHNTQAYKLDTLEGKRLFRKECTLEKSGPLLLNCLSADNFLVDYIVGPFTNVSAITFRFRVSKPVTRETFIERLRHAIRGEKLLKLYGLEDVDQGDSNRYNGTAYSAIFTEDRIHVRGDHVYMQGYFDNENSVNRFYDLAHHIATMRREMLSTAQPQLSSFAM